MSDESTSPEAEANAATAVREVHSALIAGQAQSEVTYYAAVAVGQAGANARHVEAAAAGRAETEARQTTDAATGARQANAATYTGGVGGRAININVCGAASTEPGGL